jgi:hypothetical protein
MDRSHARVAAANQILTLLFIATVLVSASGCPTLLATGIYVLDGGNLVPAEFEGLKGERVVVMCKPPSSHDFRHAGAARAVAAKVSQMLVKNVKDIDVVNPREVDEWVDESDWGDFRELAKAVNADKVVQIELEDFELYKGKTLYQGRADVNVTVYDMKDRGKEMWASHIGEVLYPTNSGIPAQDKPVQQFEREFVEVVANRVAINFYRHDPNEGFALDAMANR